MFAKLFLREAHHLAADDVESRFFKAAEHVADVALFHAIGFKDDERFLHKPPRKHPGRGMGSLDFPGAGLVYREGTKNTKADPFWVRIPLLPWIGLRGLVVNSSEPLRQSLIYREGTKTTKPISFAF